MKIVRGTPGDRSAERPTERGRSRHESKVAVVTGAARGVGRAAALLLAREGADIIALDICETLPTVAYQGTGIHDLEETADGIEGLGSRVVAVKTDIRDFGSLNDAVAHGVAELGRLDVVVANAGMTTAGPSWEIDTEHWDETIAHNLTGAFHTAKATIPVLLEQSQGGSIVFTGSVAGMRGLPYLADYCAAKHGVVGLAKTLANELAEHRIRVNVVHPYGVDSGLKVHELSVLLEQNPEQAALYVPALPDATSEPEDIADAIAWLSSDEARHVTGIELPVDRGRANR